VRAMKPQTALPPSRSRCRAYLLLLSATPSIQGPTATIKVHGHPLSLLTYLESIAPESDYFVGNNPRSALTARRVLEARVPREGHRQRAAVIQFDDQRVFRDIDADCGCATNTIR